MQHPEMARALGVRIDRIYTITFELARPSPG